MKTRNLVYSLLLASQIISGASAAEPNKKPNTGGTPPGANKTVQAAKCPMGFTKDATRKPTALGAY